MFSLNKGEKVMEEFFKVNEDADIKRGYGQRTFKIAQGMVSNLKEEDKLPKTKDGNEFPVDLWIGENKDGNDTLMHYFLY